jgi:hypothetical protein
MEALLPGVSGDQRIMTYKVKFTHSDNSRAHKGRAKVREGKEVYRHPEGRYIVLEFQGRSGKFREAFWPEEVVKDKLIL